MKKFLFVVALIMATGMGINAQTCKVQGVVRFSIMTTWDISQTQVQKFIF